MRISAWALLGATVHAAYKNRRGNPEEYVGPMDDRSYAILNSFADSETVQSMYKVKGSGPNAFVIYAMNFDTLEQAVSDMEYLDATWPNPQVAIYGMWDHKTGLQVGVSYTYAPIVDPESDIVIGEEVTGTEGAPTYPIPADCYMLMPDTIEYAEDGTELSRTPATSNADLEDKNLVSGQHPRIFA